MEERERKKEWKKDEKPGIKREKKEDVREMEDRRGFASYAERERVFARQKKEKIEKWKEVKVTNDHEVNTSTAHDIGGRVDLKTHIRPPHVFLRLGTRSDHLVAFVRILMSSAGT